MQRRFPRMPKPPRPTIRSEFVAVRIARRIVTRVNVAGFYWWSPEEIELAVFDVHYEIMRVGRPATVFGRLENRKPDGEDNHYDFEGLDKDCRELGGAIAAHELATAIEEYDDRYG